MIPESKKCPSCNLIKNQSEFARRKNTKGGYRLYSYCKKCESKRVKKYREDNYEEVVKRERESASRRKDIIKKNRKKNYEKNKIKTNKKRREDRAANPEKYREKDRKRYLKRREGLLKKAKTPEEKEKRNRRRRKRRATDKDFCLREALRRRIPDSVRGKYKSKTLENLMGCTVEELKTHLESQFWPGMSWENYGRGPDKWHVDHIRCCASFDLTKEDQQKECFHWSNLQPLWELLNREKNDKEDWVAPDKETYLPPFLRDSEEE